MPRPSHHHHQHIYPPEHRRHNGNNSDRRHGGGGGHHRNRKRESQVDYHAKSSVSQKPTKNTNLQRKWNLYVKASSENHSLKVNQSPIGSTDDFFKYFSLFDKPVNFQQKVELYMIQNGMILEEDATSRLDDDFTTPQDSSAENQEEPLKWTVRYGLRATKTNIDNLWSDLVFAAIGETFPHPERIIAVSVSLFPLYGVVSLHVYDPDLQLPVESKAERKEYLSGLVPKDLVTVPWKTIFDFSENLKAQQLQQQQQQQQQK